MSLTITPVKGARLVAGNVVGQTADITFDSSYPTGGEAVAADKFGFRSLLGLFRIGGDGDSELIHMNYDQTNGKLALSDASGELANGSDQSAVTVRVIALGLNL